MWAHGWEILGILSKWLEWRGIRMNRQNEAIPWWEPGDKEIPPLQLLPPHELQDIWYFWEGDEQDLNLFLGVETGIGVNGGKTRLGLGCGMASHSGVLAWIVPRTEEPGGLQSTGSQRVGHNCVTSTFAFTDFGRAGPCSRHHALIADSTCIYSECPALLESVAGIPQSASPLTWLSHKKV